MELLFIFATMQIKAIQPLSKKRNPLHSFVAVEIEINHNCNRACTYCPNSNQVRNNQGRMSEELFKKILQQLQAIDYRGRISYHFYNEPLLSPDLNRFVALTKEYLPNCWIVIYTNGTLLTEERLVRLLELGVDNFIVTKHHSSPVYPFEQVYKNLDPTLRTKVKLQTYKDLILTNRGGLIKGGPNEQDQTPLNLACRVPSSVVVITVNGNVLPCYEDYKEQLVMGNIYEKDVLEIWDSEKYKSFRSDLMSKKRFAHPVCKNCNCVVAIA